MLIRFKNRSLLRADEIAKANQRGGDNGMVVIIGGPEQKDEPVDTDNNLNQLDKIIVQVKETERQGGFTPAARPSPTGSRESHPWGQTIRPCSMSICGSS